MNWRDGRRRGRRGRRGQANNLADVVSETSLDFCDTFSARCRHPAGRAQRERVVGINCQHTDAPLARNVVLDCTERMPTLVVRRQDSLKQPGRGVLLLLLVQVRHRHQSLIPLVEYPCNSPSASARIYSRPIGCLFQISTENSYGTASQRNELDPGQRRLAL